MQPTAYFPNSAALRGCLALFAALLLHGCSPPTVVRATPAAETSSPSAKRPLAEPAANEVVVVINNNAVAGNHAGIFAGARLNDPAGSYLGTRSRDSNWPGPSLADYVEFQKEDGERIQIYRFKLAPDDFAAIDSRMASAGITPPLFCAVQVHNLVAGLGPFGPLEKVGWTTPASLARQLDKLIDGQAAPGECVMPDNQPC